MKKKVVLCLTLTATLIVVVGRSAAQSAAEKKESEKRKQSADPDKSWRADQVEQLLRRANQPTTVRGKVFSVRVPEAKNLIVLDFAKSPRSSFKAVILASNFSKWGGGVEEFQKRYEGKEVTVEGQITLYSEAGVQTKGPQIIVDSPKQIKEAR